MPPVEAEPLPTSVARPTLLSSAPLDDLQYEELAGSPTKDFDENGVTAHRELKCPWSVKTELAKRLMGYSYAAGGQSFYVLPHSFPGFERATVRKVHVAPWFDAEVIHDGGNQSRASYTHAQLSVDYGVDAHDGGQTGGGSDPTAPETLVEESVEGFSEFLTLSHQKLFWDAAKTMPLDKTEAPARLFSGLNWVFKRLRAPEIVEAVVDLMSHVNSTEVYSRTLKKTFAAETLLYLTPTLDRIITVDGASAWNLTTRFSHRPTGWNKFLKRGNATPQPIYDDAGDLFRTYPTGNFYLLVG